VTLLDDAPVTYEPEPPMAPRGLLARLVPIVVVFALLGLIGTAGTWAAFSASTDNPASLVTGSLVLSNTVTGQDECLSSDDAGLDVNASVCVHIFSEAAQQPGDVVGEYLTLENPGTVDADALAIHGAGCTTAVADGEAYSGSGSPTDLCELLQLVIQEVDATNTPLDRCVYPADAAVACAFDEASTVADFMDPVTGNGAFGTAATITGGLEAARAETRYFHVAVKLDPDADNRVQGRKAELALTWRIEQ
jgi:predicted ribosomally synthesized peptide with SipW-like signal peptide